MLFKFTMLHFLLVQKERMGCRMLRVSLHEERGCIFHVVLYDFRGT